MQPLPDLEGLTWAQRLEVIRKLRTDLRQVRAELEETDERAAELEQAITAALQAQENSSEPPSSTPKPNIPIGSRRRKRKGRSGRRRR